jgi:peptidoglycan/xylan/chitin deacetylase (PgdA/CDA1 family)
MIRWKIESSRHKIKKIIPQSLLLQRLPRTASNCVLLTFDDGPHPEITPKVLALLGAYNVRAIFFVVGRLISRAPELLNIIIGHGHLIGNHTYIHINGRQPPPVRYFFDVLRCQNTIKKLTGVSPNFFRPAGGRLSVASMFIPKIIGMKTINWSLDADDWRCKSIRDARDVAGRLERNIAHRDIILLHDENPYIIKILDLLLPILTSKNLDLHSGIDFLSS